MEAEMERDRERDRELLLLRRSWIWQQWMDLRINSAVGNHHRFGRCFTCSVLITPTKLIAPADKQWQALKKKRTQTPTVPLLANGLVTEDTHNHWATAEALLLIWYNYVKTLFSPRLKIVMMAECREEAEELLQNESHWVQELAEGLLRSEKGSVHDQTWSDLPNVTWGRDQLDSKIDSDDVFWIVMHSKRHWDTNVGASEVRTSEMRYCDISIHVDLQPSIPVSGSCLVSPYCHRHWKLKWKFLKLFILLMILQLRSKMHLI